MLACKCNNYCSMCNRALWRRIYQNAHGEAASLDDENVSPSCRLRKWSFPAISQFPRWEGRKWNKVHTQTETEELLSPNSSPSNQEFRCVAAPPWAVVTGWQRLGFLTQLIDQRRHKIAHVKCYTLFQQSCALQSNFVASLLRDSFCPGAE